MRFYIQVETNLGWRYLRRGLWDAVTAHTEVALIRVGNNTTDSLSDAAMWTQRGIIRSSGPCSFDKVKRAVALEFPLREVAVRCGEIHSVSASTSPESQVLQTQA